jgi:hypothetical protein
MPVRFGSPPPELPSGRDLTLPRIGRTLQSGRRRSIRGVEPARTGTKGGGSLCPRADLPRACRPTPSIEFVLQIPIKEAPRSANFRGRGLRSGNSRGIWKSSAAHGRRGRSSPSRLPRNRRADRQPRRIRQRERRKGYGPKALLGACLVKSLFALPTWTFVAALIAEHPGLQEAIGGCPSVWAMYRFGNKLRANRPALARASTRSPHRSGRSTRILDVT